MERKMMASIGIAAESKATREILEKVFDPPGSSPWAIFPRKFLEEIGLHPKTYLFYHEDAEILLAVVWRKAPTSERFVGNFPISKNLIEWLALRERGPDGVSAYVATVESMRDGQILGFKRAGDLADLCLGRVEPATSPASSEEFFWLDDDLHPVPTRGAGRRPFKTLDHRPFFLVFLDAEE